MMPPWNTDFRAALAHDSHQRRRRVVGLNRACEIDRPRQCLGLICTALFCFAALIRCATSIGSAAWSRIRCAALICCVALGFSAAPTCLASRLGHNLDQPCDYSKSIENSEAWRPRLALHDRLSKSHGHLDRHREFDSFLNREAAKVDYNFYVRNLSSPATRDSRPSHSSRGSAIAYWTTDHPRAIGLPKPQHTNGETFLGTIRRSGVRSLRGDHDAFFAACLAS